jgi:hypothetical protein
MKLFVSAILLFFLLAFISCNQKQAPVLFQLMDKTGIDFNNKVEDGKIENTFLFRNFYNGGGVSIGDINNDGKADVFFTSNMGDNKLYLNKGNWQFEDITPKAGFRQDSMWSTGVVMADINGDGWLDIYVCNSGHMSTGNRRNKLYINNHNLTFTEEAAKYGLDISAYTTQVSFFDYDLDGDLDCFMINNTPININKLGYANDRDLPEQEWQVAPFLKGGGDHLFQNNGGHFTDVTKQAGIHGSLISFGLGVSVTDVNGDGYPDVYVSNDSYERDYLYINQQNGTFKDGFEQCMEHTSFSSMGADVADINNDGYPDIFTTDMLPESDYRIKTTGAFDNYDVYNIKLKQGFYQQYMKNCLQLNNQNGKFCEIANYSGVSATDWSWGALFFDADNDGYNDIYVCNGVNRDLTNLDFMDFFANEVNQKMVLTGKKESVDKILAEIPRTPLPNKVFRNKGNLQFEDVGEQWGFTQGSWSNGAAYGDLDGDGDLDLVINNENGPAFIYKNNSREQNNNNYISILLKGDSLNTFAIGSTIKVYTGNEVITREVVPSRGFQSSMDYRQVIGLGKATAIDSMIVIWPNRRYDTYIHPQLNKLYQLTETGLSKPYHFLNQNNSHTVYFDSIITAFDKHTEDEYVDFYYERNVPEMLSKEGPKAAVGDVNGDGLDDVYIGGALNQGGQLYLQTSTGDFIKKEEPVFKQFLDFEDEAVLLFDADKDGDLDLFIGPGGNNMMPNSRQTQLRLYKNDGKGNFTLDAAAFPNNANNIAIAVANDIDGDGDLDLFVGGRSVPHDYGMTPQSYIFMNDGNGHFSDIAKNSTGVSNAGMITGAVWADVTGNASKELIVTGEWMAPRIFSYNNQQFTEVKSNLNNLYGLWQTVAAADVNGDGRQDLILGNIGENFYLHPDSAKPVKLFINDFNQNGNRDKILTYTVDEKDMPVFMKRELQDQIPAIKKQNLRHEDYAKKSIQELFPEELLNKSVVRQFNYCNSVVAMNKGNGQFEISRLPSMTQLSSVNAIHCMDVNSDGFTDLVLGGNLFALLPQFERLDASYGDVLINNGKGVFSFTPQKQTGLQVQGEVRDIAAIETGKGKQLLFLRNNDYPVMYRLHNNTTNSLASK